MKKFISMFLSVIIFSSTFVFGMKKPLIAKAEENNIQSFINQTIKLIKENDADKVFVAENEEKLETSSYALSVNETEDTTFQTCRLIVKSDTTPDKLNSVGIASGFLDYHIVQFENEEDTKNAFDFYSECYYVEDVFCDRVFDASSNYTVDQSNQITYKEEVPERLDSWGSQVTGMYELMDYIKSNYILADLPQIEVAVLDSGVDLGHEFFQGRLIKKSFNSSGDGVEKSENDTEYGHGTNVTSVIVDNTLENVKVSNYKISHKGNGSFSGFIAGVLQAAEDEVDIVNMSFSFWGTSKEEQDLAESIIKSAIEKGCLVISSSGNYNVDIDYQYSVPTSIDGVISVAASSVINYPTSWSSRGKSVSVMAPGEDIPVASPNDKYVLTSGTSFSSPLTVSLYALLKTLYPSESNKQLQIRVESTADESDLEGIVNMYGYGIIDAIGASSLKRAETPIINNENEIYEGKAEIKITVPQNSVVYYTMDQTYPSKDNGVLYNEKEPIIIEDDFFFIHAVAYSEDGFRSEYVSELIQAATLGTNDMFEINNDGIITNYCGSVNYLKIPNEINGIKVLGFSENLFSESNFHGVWFSDEITT
ncbi:MAG: S8 family serine peptidase, partial [Ruminococcus sp.]|nr:S8 family serine peptidase [Ruminococcus sp.]